MSKRQKVGHVLRPIRTSKVELITDLREESRKIHVCDQCDYTTQRKGDMTKHKRIHSGSKPFHCDQCDWSFKQSSHLRMHILRKHSTEKNPFRCHSCGVSFRTFTLLQKHKRNDHAVYTASTAEAVGVAAILNDMPAYAMRRLAKVANESVQVSHNGFPGELPKLKSLPSVSASNSSSPSLPSNSNSYTSLPSNSNSYNGTNSHSSAVSALSTVSAVSAEGVAVLTSFVDQR